MQTALKVNKLNGYSLVSDWVVDVRAASALRPLEPYRRIWIPDPFECFGPSKFHFYGLSDISFLIDLSYFRDENHSQLK